MRELDTRLQFLPFLMLELEGPGAPKADRGDDGPLAKLRLVIGVPGDAVLPVAVAVEQDAVEDDSRRRLHGAA